MGNTLTKMLEESIFYADFIIKSTGDRDKDEEQYIELLKNTFKGWLKTVSLPQHISGDPWEGVESTRRLLITLIDEP